MSALYREPGKRGLDVIGSVVLLIVLSPLLAVLALLVRIRIGAPVLFRQRRPGRQGTPFVLLKFRTMTEATGANGTVLPDSARLLPLGRTLRSLSLDELPELWNVLTGEMSIVGFVTEHAVITRILAHLERRGVEARAGPWAAAG